MIFLTEFFAKFGWLDWIELAGSIFGVLCVVLTIRRNIWCWPVGLVQVILFIIIFYQVKLYSDLGLHVIYVGLQFYGWYAWTRKPSLDDELGEIESETSSGSIMVTSLTVPSRMAWVLTTVIGTLTLGFVMKTFTDASLPFGDAFTTVASLVATYLLAAKKVESWMFWIAVDVIAVGIYYYKELIPTSILYSVFLVLAIIGLTTWTRIMLQSPDRSVQILPDATQ